MIADLAAELASLIAPNAVSADPAARARASRDGSHLSPIISAKQPLGVADLVVHPRTGEEIATAVAAAVHHRVPVTVRGKGTCNYGQGIPMAGGLVIDTSRAKAIIDIGEGWITAEAGATMRSLELAANATGQQLWMYPSTVNSTVGGFLSGGSGGTGSIAHGTLAEGFVRALDVAYATGDAGIVPVEGDDATAFLHSYGTAGVICRATVALETLADWVAVYASFADMDATLAAIRETTALEPAPRLVSGDPPIMAGSLPADLGIRGDRCSMRVIVAREALADLHAIVRAHHGTVDAERTGARETLRMSMVSFNHAIEWLQMSHPGRYFHLEVSGGDLARDHAELAAVYPGGIVHVEGMRGMAVALLAAEFESERAVYDGFDRIRDLGFDYHNCHQWRVDVRPDLVRRTAEITDPLGLLNPGKLARTVPGEAPLATVGTA